MYLSIALFIQKHWKELILALTLIFIVFFMFFLSADREEPDIGGTAAVSPLVTRYEPLITKYAEKYGVPQHVQLLMAKMMQESGGRGGDPMQSSESLGLPPNTINDPEKSIDAGVKEFSEVLAQAEGEIKLTLQAYNFGPAFIPYAQERGGYSKEVAVAFSNMMATKLNWSRYGDVNYVDNVLRYLGGGIIGDLTQNDYGFIRPIELEITSPFGYRIDPFTGIATLHAGTDFSCNRQAVPIYAVQKGKVIRAGWQNPSNHNAGYGQRVYVDHGNGMITVYAHMSQITVSQGEQIPQGQQVGRCGTTGSSTGMHLHFTLEVNGQRVDPAGIVF